MLCINTGSRQTTIRSPVKRIFVHELIPGRVLDDPLYAGDGRLLLARGRVLTHDMAGALLRAGMTHAFAGEWDQAAADRFGDVRPLKAYRTMADAMAVGLRAEMEKALRLEGEALAAPAGAPFAGLMDNAFQAHRAPEFIAECAAIRDAGMAVASDVMAGNLDPETTAASVATAVHGVMDAFVADRSLINIMASVKGAAPYLYEHALGTSVLSINIATALGYNTAQVQEIGMAGLLQDVGMAMVPERIVNLPRRLAPTEMIDIQKHAAYGLYLLEKIRHVPLTVRFAMYQSHERIDGSGYPRRRKGDRIHVFAQIVGVADMFDALVSDRPWRRALHPYRAMEKMVRDASKGKFDPAIIRALLAYIGLYPVGCRVELSDGSVASVVHGNEKAIDRPVVKVLRDGRGRYPDAPVNIDLNGGSELRVKDIYVGEDIPMEYLEPA